MFLIRVQCVCVCSRVCGLRITDRNHCATEDTVSCAFSLYCRARDATPRPQPTQKLEFSILLSGFFFRHTKHFSLTFFHDISFLRPFVFFLFNFLSVNYMEKLEMAAADSSLFVFDRQREKILAPLTQIL